jgi:hypothetical protein
MRDALRLVLADEEARVVDLGTGGIFFRLMQPILLKTVVVERPKLLEKKVDQ